MITFRYRVRFPKLFPKLLPWPCGTKTELRFGPSFVSRLILKMADEMEVEDMLEAPFKKGNEKVSVL